LVNILLLLVTRNAINFNALSLTQLSRLYADGRVSAYRTKFCDHDKRDRYLAYVAVSPLMDLIGVCRERL